MMSYDEVALPAACSGLLCRDSFSSNQWRKGIGLSRCHSCVRQGHCSEDVFPKTKRQNLSRTAEMNRGQRENPFAEGTFRWVGEGKYTSGPRDGERCVFKWFKSGNDFEETFFAKDIKANQKATEIIQQFNCSNFIHEVIRINQPEVWTCGSHGGQKYLFEPFIDGYQKFNSNSGWAIDAGGWPQVMQALSHFSYHASGGQFVLCDLQGGVFSGEAILTDPVILSRYQEYGVTDLGADGISNFFARHECNEFCSASWTKPSNRVARFRAQISTSMLHVPYQRDRSRSPVRSRFRSPSRSRSCSSSSSYE